MPIGTSRYVKYFLISENTTTWESMVFTHVWARVCGKLRFKLYVTYSVSPCYALFVMCRTVRAEHVIKLHLECAGNAYRWDCLVLLFITLRVPMSHMFSFLSSRFLNSRHSFWQTLYLNRSFVDSLAHITCLHLRVQKCIESSTNFHTLCV
jgi:hypothetical protein